MAGLNVQREFSDDLRWSPRRISSRLPGGAAHPHCCAGPCTAAHDRPANLDIPPGRKAYAMMISDSDGASKRVGRRHLRVKAVGRLGPDRYSPATGIDETIAPILVGEGALSTPAISMKVSIAVSSDPQRHRTEARDDAGEGRDAIAWLGKDVRIGEAGPVAARHENILYCHIVTASTATRPRPRRR